MYVYTLTPDFAEKTGLQGYADEVLFLCAQVSVPRFAVGIVIGRNGNDQKDPERTGVRIQFKPGWFFDDSRNLQHYEEVKGLTKQGLCFVSQLCVLYSLSLTFSLFSNILLPDFKVRSPPALISFCGFAEVMLHVPEHTSPGVSRPFSFL